MLIFSNEFFCGTGLNISWRSVMASIGESGVVHIGDDVLEW